jgi:hypothetical protein
VCGVTDDAAAARDEVAATSRSGSADLWPVSGGQVGQNDRSMEGRRHWTTWIYPQKLLDVHPVLGTLGVVALVGSAAGYGAMACPSGALFVGVASTVFAGFCCLAFSDRPGCLGRGLAVLIRTGRRETLRTAAPYMWRWGLVCTLVALVSTAFAGGVIACR